MSGLAAVEEIGAEPRIAAKQCLPVAELGIDLAPAGAQRQPAQRIGRDAGLTVEVRVPPEADSDWLDVLNQRGQS